MIRPRAAALLSAVAGLALAANSHATVIAWNTAAGGSAALPANWNPAQIPSASDSADFNLNGTYTVDWGASTSQTASMGISNSPSVTWNFLVPHTTGPVTVKNSAGSPILTLATGTLNCSSMAVGQTVTAGTATLNVNDHDADLVAGTLLVGSGSTGVLNITAGGFAEATGLAHIGQVTAVPGTVLVSGVNAVGPTRSTFRVSAPAGLVVGEAGPATLTVSSGGLTTVTGPMTIAPVAAQTCVTTVGGLAVGSPATLSVGQGLDISHNTSAAAAGTGSLIINQDGVVSVGGQTTVGDPNGGPGLLRIDNNGSFTTAGLVYAGVGTFDFRSGSVTVTSGPFTLLSTAISLGSNNAATTLTLNGPGTTTFPATSGSMMISGIPHATLTLTGGREIISTSGIVTIGFTNLNFLGQGILNISSGARLTANNNGLFVGNQGQGFVNVTAGGILNTDNLAIGVNNPGGRGTVLITGAGTQANVAFTRLGISGVPGSLTISDGAVFTSSNPVNGIITGTSAGSLTLDHATLTAAGTIRYTNTLTPMVCNQGVLTAVMLNLGGSGLDASGTIAARMLQTGPLAVTATGDLDMGLGTATDGIVLSGALAVGPWTVQLHDADLAVLPPQVTINGGTLAATNGMRLPATGILRGSGLIGGNLDNLGAIQPLSSGLAFLGDVSGVGTGFSGTRATFLSGSRFLGRGLIDCEVSTLHGSSFQPSGDLEMGNASSANGVSLGGDLLVAGATVILRDQDQVELFGVCDLGERGGTLIVDGGLFVGNNDFPGQLVGSGTVEGRLTNASIVAPGHSAGSIRVSSSYIQQANGTLVIELGGTGEGEFDTLAVDGDVVLDGLLRVELIPGYTPAAGDSWNIVTFPNERFGEFAAVEAPGFEVQYRSNSVRLIFLGVPCDPDLNQDGNVDQDDITFLINVVGGGPNDSGIDPDFNHDGNVDQDDVLALIAVIAGGACP